MPTAEAITVTTDALPRSGRALDAVNFFLADVHSGLGPYLAVYLLTVRQWHEGQIGLVMSIAGIAGVIAQTPAGALVDATRAKRALIVTAALVVAVASMALLMSSSFISVAITQGVVNKLLHEPTVRVKEAAGTPRGDYYADALSSLFDLPTEPTVESE